jgi:hypothetical protein
MFSMRKTKKKERRYVMFESNISKKDGAIYRSKKKINIITIS